MNEILLVEGFAPCGHMELQINENKSKHGNVMFRGKFQEAEAINKNKRRYPFSILDENVQMLMDTVNARGLIGELDHPADSIVHFEKASHIVTKLWWEGNSLMGEGEIMPTPCGEILRVLIENGVRIGISSRGIGSGKVDENGILVIGESFKLITFDAVADPSTNNAYQKLKSGKQESYIPTQNNRSAVKNEGSSIHKKEAFIACFGGVINDITKDIKAKIR